MTAAEIVNLILEKLRTGRVEFISISETEVIFQYSHHKYVASWQVNRIDVSPYTQYYDPNEFRYSFRIQKILRGYYRDDEGNLIKPEKNESQSLNEYPSSNQKPSSEATDWINADDLLPNDSRWVLIACATKGMTEFDVCQAFKDREKGGWTSVDGGFCQHVRYWAELPKGPKQ
jgi:hypothetical protein